MPRDPGNRNNTASLGRENVQVFFVYKDFRGIPQFVFRPFFSIMFVKPTKNNCPQMFVQFSNRLPPQRKHQFFNLLMVFRRSG